MPSNTKKNLMISLGSVGGVTAVVGAPFIANKQQSNQISRDLQEVKNRMSVIDSKLNNNIKDIAVLKIEIQYIKDQLRNKPNNMDIADLKRRISLLEAKVK